MANNFSLNEYLVIDTTGSVGIGAANPTAKLVVTGSSTVANQATVVFKAGNATQTGGVGVLDVQNSVGTSLLFVSGSGNVGIGETSPTSRLHVTGPANVWSTQITSTTTAGQSFGLRMDAGTNSSDAAIQVRERLSGVTTFYLRGDGNLGINTSIPTARLFVSGSSTTSTPTMIVREGVVSPTGGAGILDAQSSAGTSLLFVSGSGFVGIGTNLRFASDALQIGSVSTSGARSIFLADNGYGLRVSAGAGSSFIQSTGVSVPLQFLAGTSNNGNYLFTSTGNVGIGAGTNVTSKLLVTGSGATSSTSTAHFVNSSGTSLFFVRDDGNVGIGTASPAGRLDVSSTGVPSIYATRPGLGSSYGAAGLGWLRFRDADNAFDAAAVYGVGFHPGSNGALLFYTAAAGTLNERARIDTSGNFGIGTNAPAARLHVTGSSTSSDQTALIRGGVPSQLGPVLEVEDYLGNTLLVVSGSGNVGVGTNNPSSRFHVSDSQANATVRLHLANTSGNGGPLRIGYFGDSGGFHITANGNPAHTNLVSNTVTRDYTARFAFEMLNLLTTTSDNSYVDFRFAGGSTFSSVMRVRADGNVGIGTTAMDSRLVVNGNSVFSGSINPDGDLTRDLGSSTKRWRNIYATNISGSLTGSNVTAGQVVVAGTGGVLSGSNDFVWDNANRRVGIGATSPTALLSLRDSSPTILITDSGLGTPSITFSPVDGGIGTRASLSVNFLTAEARLAAGAGGGSYFTTFYTNGSERLRISSNGNVGIGTTLMDSAFVVNGNSVLSGTLSPDSDNARDLGSSDKRWRTLFATNISGSLTGSNVSAGQVVVAGTGGVLSGSNNLFWDNTNRGLGIGTSTSLSYPLTAFAPAATSVIYSRSGNTNGAALFLGDSSGILGQLYMTSTGTWLDYSTSLNFRSGYGGTNQMIIDSSGRVGIGVTNPTSNLQLGDVSVIGQDTNSAYHGANFTATGVNRIKSNYTVQTMYDSAAGRITFRRAASGLAGSAITWSTSMAISDTGNVGVGVSGVYQSIASRFEVTGSGATSSTSTAHFVNSSGASLLFVRDDGNVGIGTSSPTQALHVRGSTGSDVITLVKNDGAGRAVLNLDSGGTSDSAVRFSSQATLKWGILNNSNDLGFYSYTTSTYSMYIAGSTGNVGINTTASSAKLTVSGSSTASTPTMVVREGVASATGGAGAFDVQNSAGTSILFVTGSGNVGISTTSPLTSAKLTIVTSANTAAYAVNWQDNIDIATMFFSSGYFLRVNGDASNRSLRLDANSSDNTANILFRTGGAGTLSERVRIDVAGNVGIGTNNPNGNRLAISGGNLSVTGSVLPGVTSTYDLGSTAYRWRDLYARTGSFSGDVTITGDLTVNGTQFIVNTQVVEIEDNAILLNAGPSPASTGGIYVADTTTGVTGSLIWDTVTDQWKAGRLGSETTLVSGSGTTNYLAKWSGVNGIGSSIVYDDGTNVGIGTASPAINNRLDVVGGAVRVNEDGVGTHTLQLRSNWAGTGASAIQVQTNTPLAFIVNAADRGRIDTSGRFLIGTNTSPVGAGDMLTIVAPSSGDMTFSVSTCVAKLGTNGSAVFIGARSNHPVNLQTNNTTRVFIDTAGNVGIGTTQLDSTFVVNGNTVLSGTLNPDIDNTRDLGSALKRWRNLFSANITGNLTGSNLTAGQVVVAGMSGLISGSNLFFWDNSTTRLGIGHSTPAYALDVRVPGNTVANLGGVGLGGALYFGNGASQVNHGNNEFSFYSLQNRGITFYPGNAFAVAMVPSGRVGIGGTNPLARFEVTGSGATSSTSTMHLVNSSGTSLLFVRDDGNVGVGTSSPSYTIDARAPSNADTILRLVKTTSVSTTMQAVGGGLTFGVDTGAGTTERVRIDTNGNVGIGTSSYTARLLVSGSATASTPTMVVREGVVSPTGGVGVLNVQNSAGTSLLFVSGSGFVGIGTNTSAIATPPRLNVVRGSDGQIALLERTSGGVAISFGTTSTTKLYNSWYSLSGGYYKIGYSGALTEPTDSVSLVQDISGNVGLGTASPSYKLDVIGAQNSVGAAISTAYGTSTTVYSAFRFNNIGLSWGNSEIRNYVDGSTSLGSALSFWTTQNGTGTLTERVRIDNNGNVGIGTTSFTARLFVSGSATASTPTMIVREGVVSPTGGALTFEVDNSAGTTLFAVSGSGNVGIGTTISRWQSDSKSLDIGSYTSIANVLGFQAVVSNNAYYDSGYKYRTGGYVASAFVQANGGFQWLQAGTGTNAGDAITFSTPMVLSSTGNVGIGNSGVADRLAVNGTMSVTGSLLPGVDGSYNLGTSTKRWAEVRGVNVYGQIFPTSGTPGSVLYISSTGLAAQDNSNLFWNDSTKRLGIGTSSPGFRLEVVGDFAATTKSFVIPHPLKPGWKLRYGSLESPYHGVRLTGEAEVVDGICEVVLPDYISTLCKQEGAQVQVTNLGHNKVLWVDALNVVDNKFVVKSKYWFFMKLFGKKSYKFYWSFTAVRKDIDDMVVEFNPCGN